MNILDFSAADDSSSPVSIALHEYRMWRRANVDADFLIFSTAHPDLDAEVLIELAAVDLIHQITAGVDAQAETYINATKLFSSNTELSLDLIDAEICARSDKGESIDPKSLARRFPNLQKHFPGLLQVHDLDMEASDELRAGVFGKVTFGEFVATNRIYASIETWEGVEPDTRKPVTIFRFNKPPENTNEDILDTLEQRKQTQTLGVPPLLGFGFIGSDGCESVYAAVNCTSVRKLGEFLDSPACEDVEEPTFVRWIIDVLESIAELNEQIGNKEKQVFIPLKLDKLLVANSTSDNCERLIFLDLPLLWNHSEPLAKVEADLIRSVGVLLFCISLKEPDFQRIESHLNDGFPPINMQEVNSDISSETNSIYLACVHRKRKNRYRKLVDLIDDLKRLESGQPVVATKLLRKWF